MRDHMFVTITKTWKEKDTSKIYWSTCTYKIIYSKNVDVSLEQDLIHQQLVQEFPLVFQEKLLGLPPDRGI